MAKNVDFKQLMLQKGEKIGMGAALALMLILVAFGAVSAVTSDNPAHIAEDIRAKATTIETTLMSGPALSPREVPPNLTKPLEKNAVKLDPYRSGTDNIVPTGQEDDKRRNPDIYPPVEGKAELVQAPVKVLIVSPQGEKTRIAILKRKTAPKEEGEVNPQVKAFVDRLKGHPKYLKRIVSRYRNVPGLVDYYKKIMGDSAKDEFDLELVDSEKIDKDTKLATTVQPQRMVIVSAAFPYQAQISAYTRALNQSLDKLALSKDSMPQFLPFNVQRRALDANGKVREAWADLDLVGNYATAFQYQFASEPEDPALKDVIFKGLVMARPQLARGEYGRPKLANIDETLGTLLKAKSDKPTATVVSPLEKQMKGLNPFGDVATMEDKAPKTAQATLKTGELREMLVPKYCLVRFIDADEKLKPGMTYQYRLQIRVVNPNYGRPREELAYPSLAEDKELVSPWWPKEDSKDVIQVHMASEFRYYGTELDDKALKEKTSRDPGLINDKNVVFLQAHRWLEKVRLNPEIAATQVPVGDWSVCDIPVRRGEFISRTEQVDLPIWSPLRERYQMAVPPPAPKAASGLMRRPKGATGIPINFSPVGDPDLLVDFEGGKISQSFRPTEKGRSIDVKEDAAVEYLILRADGSLIVRNSRADKEAAKKQPSYLYWEKLMKDVGRKTSGGGNSGGKNDPGF